MIAIDLIDRDTLPQGLLPIAKAHMRVNFATDDDYIKNCLLRAIDLVERHSGARIFSLEATWTPRVATRSTYQVPLQPVSDFTAATGTGDVSAEYRIVSGTSVDPVYLSRIDGSTFHPDLEVVLVAGYEAEDLPPQYLDPILRIAAHFYEHRESVDASGLASIPQWMNDLLLGNWIPRA